MATYIAAGTPGTTSATLPAGTAAGDYVCVCAYRSAGTAPTLPANWTNVTTNATNPSHRVAYREYDGVWTMPTFTNATRCVSFTVRPPTGGECVPGAATSSAATNQTITYPALTLQNSSGSSVVIRGAVHTRPDVTIPTPTGHTLIDSNGTQPGYGTFRLNTTTSAPAATSATSRSTTYTSFSVEVKDVYVGTLAQTDGQDTLAATVSTQAPSAITVAAYRFFDQGTETGSVALGAQDTPITGVLSTGDGLGSLRLLMQSTTAVDAPATDDWQLQWEKNANGTWTNVAQYADSYEGFSGVLNVSTGYGQSPRDGAGQSFLGNGGVLASAEFKLFKAAGTATGTTTAVLYQHSGTYGTSSVPTTTVLATSTNSFVNDSFGATSAGAAWYKFNFAPGVTLTNGAPYFIAVKTTLPTGVLLSAASSSSVGHGGNVAYNAPPWTASLTSDMGFRVSTAAPVSLYDDPSLTHGQATTNRLTGGTGTFVAGKVSETGLASDVGITGNNFTELVFATQVSQSAFVNGDQIRFRVLKNGLTTGMTYSQVPLINVASTASFGNLDVTDGVDTFAATATFTPPPLGPPNLLEYQSTTFNVAGSPKTFPSITWAAGDLIVVASSVDRAFDMTPTPTVSGLTFTQLLQQGTSAGAGVRLWKAIAASSGSGVISVALSGTQNVWGAALWHYEAGADVYDVTGVASNAGPGFTFATSVVIQADGADVIYVRAQDMEGTGGTTTPLTGLAGTGNFTERVDTGGTLSSTWIGDWLNQTSGTHDYGTTTEPVGTSRDSNTIIFEVYAGTGTPVEPTSTLAATDGRDTMAASGQSTAPTFDSTLVATDGTDTIAATATITSISTLAVTDGRDTFAATPTFGPTSTMAATDGTDTFAAVGTFGTYLNRTLDLEPRNGTTSHTVTFTPATAGNFLIAFAEGSVTSTTPAGWTLRSSAINFTGLYCWTKTASAGESSFTTTHNGSNYPVGFVVYEYPAGSAFVTQATATLSDATQANPSVTLSSGTTYTLFSALGWSDSTVGGAMSSTWSGAAEDVDTNVDAGGGTDGYLFGVAIQNGVTGVTSYTATPTVTGFTGGSSERLTVAFTIGTGVVTSTATLAVTDGPDTFAATATFTSVATLAQTDGRDTFAATPTFGPTATLAVTDGLDTFAATATFTSVSTLAQTDGRDTFAATPTFGPTATLAVTDGLDTFAATATITSTATLAQTDGRDTFAAVPTFGPTSTLAVTDGTDTMVAAGQSTAPTFTSTLAVTDGLDTFAGAASAGAPGVDSTLVITDGRDTIVASGQHTAPTFNSTLAQTDGQDLFAGTATIASNSSLAQTDGVDTMVASGQTTAPTFTSTLAQTDGRDTFAGASTFGPTATLAITDGLDTIVASGQATAPTFTSTLAVTDGTDTIVASGAFIAAGSSSLVATDGTDTIVASGQATAPTFTSTLAQTDGRDIFAATPTFGPTATLAVTDGLDTIAATGQVTAPGVNAALAATDGLDTFSGAAQVTITSVLVATDGLDTLNAAIVAVSTGALLATDGRDTFTATGTTTAPTFTSTMAQTDGRDIIAASGQPTAPIATSTLVAFDGRDTMVASGQTVVPTLTATLFVTDGRDLMTAVAGAGGLGGVVLNDADAVRLGIAVVNAVYAGAIKVWP